MATVRKCECEPVETVDSCKSQDTAVDALDLRTEVEKIKSEVEELRFYLDKELNKSEQKTAQSLEEIKSRITDAEEQIVIAQKTAESLNTTTDASDLRTELEKVKESLADTKGELSDLSIDFNNEKAYTLKHLSRKVAELDKCAIKGVDLSEIPEGVVLDAEPVANSTELRASVISDSMSIGEISDALERFDRYKRRVE